MTTRRPTDPAALAARLGARAFGCPVERWWTVAQIAAHYGYTTQTIHDWINEDGWAADLERRGGGRGYPITIRCATPPPPPPDGRAGRDTVGRAAVVAAVAAAGGRPGRGRRAGRFWADIGAQCGCSASKAHGRYLWAIRLREVDR